MSEIFQIVCAAFPLPSSRLNLCQFVDCESREDNRRKSELVRCEQTMLSRVLKPVLHLSFENQKLMVNSQIVYRFF